MVIDLDALERLAAEATPGPWAWDTETLRGEHRNAIFYPRGGRSDTPLDLVNHHSDAVFIAACDPQTVAALVRAVRAAMRVGVIRSHPKLGFPTNIELTDRAKELAAALAPFRREPPA